MTKDYLDPLLRLIRDTPNDRAGIKTVADSLADTVTEIAGDQKRLAEQEAQVMKLFEHYTELEALIGDPDATRVERVARTRAAAHETPTLNQLRRRVLSYATNLGAEDETISVAYLTERLHQEYSELPWSNVPAAVATILNGSRSWAKVRTGVYRFTGVTEEEDLRR